MSGSPGLSRGTIEPLQFCLSRTVAPAQPKAFRASSLGKRARPSVSLSALQFDDALPHGESSGDDVPNVNAPGTDSVESDRPSDYDGRRKRVKRKMSRIARPRDSMPGFKKRGRFGGSGRSGSSFKPPKSGTTTVGKKYLNRGVSVASYYGKDMVNGRDDDELNAAHESVASEQVARLDSSAGQTEDSQAAAPDCVEHGLRCDRVQVRKRGPNRGRFFYKCAHPQRYQQCSFFMWEDDVVPPDVRGSGDGGGADDDSELNIPDAIFGSERLQIETPLCGCATAKPGPCLEDSCVQLQEHVKRDLCNVLQDNFEHEEFRPGQLHAMQTLLRGESSVAVLPTGGGKSLIYQMFATVRPGMVVVVTPLLSLMADQLASLPDFLPGASLRSGQSFASLLATEKSIRKGELKVLFITPERLFSERFQVLFSSLQPGSVSLVAIDEAHCISEMGHNFRTSYLRLEQFFFGFAAFDVKDGAGQSVREGCVSSKSVFREPLLLALTATATTSVVADICRSLRVRDGNVTTADLSRANLELTASRVDGTFDARARELVRRLNAEPIASLVLEPKSKEQALDVVADDGAVNHPARVKQPALSRQKESDELGWGKMPRKKRSRASVKIASGIILVYVSKQRDCDSLCNYLRSTRLSFQGKVEAYHAGMTLAARVNVQRDFDKGRISVLVATIAFGMGLNCHRVRGVLHFDLPFSMEAYSQEIGRAGRDGESAFCHVFVNDHDMHRLVSRAHSDGVDYVAVRTFLRNLFRCRDSGEHLEGVVSADGDTELGSLSAMQEFSSSETIYVSMAHRRIELELDLRPEMAETICTYVERTIPSFTVLSARPGTLSMKFFTSTPAQLLEEGSTLSRHTRDTLSVMMKRAKNMNGRYSISLYEDRKSASTQISTDDMLRAVREIKAQRHGDFELSDDLLLATAPKGLCGNQALVDKVARMAHCRLSSVEKSRRRRADTLCSVVRKAEGLLSDLEQTQFIHRSLAEYFTGSQGCSGDAESKSKDELDQGALVTKVDSDAASAIRTATIQVLRSREYSMRKATTPRQIARILHGIQSPGYSAKYWCRCPQWGKYLHVDFNAVTRETSKAIRTWLLRNRITPREA